jgi:hypothetical protein
VVPGCSSVVSGAAGDGGEVERAPDEVADRLADARAAWMGDRDTRALRRALLEVLRELE